MTDLFDTEKQAYNAQNQSALPVFLQIAEHIARQISAGHLLPDAKLPGEREMAHEYKVAVGTLRKSLAHLTQLGLLRRKQGSGNYIARNENAASLYSFFRLELHHGGGLPSARLLDVTKLQKPDDLPEFGTSSFGHRFRRIRYLDDWPVALEEIWLDGACADHIEAANVSDALYHYYKTELGQWVVKAEDSIGLAPPPSWYKGALNNPMGFIERFGWSQDAIAIEYSRTWYAADRARYVSRLK
ncbi:MAG: GntR family transcriptional regulator [Candidatus Puniceispirillaceae bacterium]